MRLASYALTILLVAPCCAQTDFPYTAFIDDETAIVRGGPGTKFYPTESLPWATRVEVYEHQDRWAAIRPTAQSHSWVLASNITKNAEQQDLGVVTEPTSTMVGSRMNDRTDVDYVSLKEGDVVEILGEAEIAVAGTGYARCYKIVPPAGEFRWVRISQLSTTPPTKEALKVAQIQFDNENEDSADNGKPWIAPADEVAATATVDEEAPIDGTMEEEKSAPIALIQFESDQIQLADLPAQPSVESEPLPLLEPPPLTTSTKPPNDPLPSISESGSSASPPPSPDSNPVASQPYIAPDQPAQIPVRQESLSQTTPVAEPPQGSFGLPASGIPASSRLEPRPRPVALGPVARKKLGLELVRIETELTEQSSQPPETWQLEDLRVRAQAVIDTSDQAEHRFTAQHVIAKIAQMRDIQRRHQDNVTEQNRIARLMTDDSRWANQPSTTRIASAVGGGTSYDGEGWLMPVVTDDPSFPRYVLTDEQGNIKQFVSPKPGLNLGRYAQKRIAVYGQRGMLPTYEQPHLMAERIISLDKVSR